MNYKRPVGEVAQTSDRRWGFADYEFDEPGRGAFGQGPGVETVSKPVDIVLQLDVCA
jgi:hypothetical protein